MNMLKQSAGRIRPALVFIALLLPAAPAPAAEAPAIKVAFLPAGHEDNEFWVSMTQFAGAVAEDLNIDLQVTYPGRRAYRDDARALLGKLDEGTYFVTVYLAEITRELLPIAEDRKIRSFLINSDVIEAERKQVGKPRETFRHWIGHMHPDDVQAGYRVAGELLGHFDLPGAVRMIAVNGDEHVQADADRQAGLRRRLAESPGATLLAVEQADWMEDRAQAAVAKLLQEHPGANAVWAASDPMALGAAAAFEQAGKRPGRDFVAASVDWTGRGLAAVRAGDMLASVGGHFMEAGLALLLIYDHHHGRDFTADPGVHFKTPMHTLNRDGIDAYFEAVGASPDWSSIDFRQFTKTHNPDLERYDFSWPAFQDRL